MIPWWLIPVICTLVAAGLLQLTSSDSNMPYRGFMVIATVIVLGLVLTAIWLFCFLLSLIY